MIIAPVLAVVAWLAVGELAGEKPQPAKSGHSYQLLERSNCRYISGACDLENGDVEISLSYRENLDGGSLKLNSSHGLQSAVVGIGENGATAGAQLMTSSGSGTRQWFLSLPTRPTVSSSIYLVVTIAGSQYFGEASAIFLQPASVPAG